MYSKKMVRLLHTFFALIVFSCSCFSQQTTAALKLYTSGMEKYNAANYELAIIDYSNAIKESPEFVEAYFQRGCAKHYSDDYKGAIEDFNKAIELRPDSEMFYWASDEDVPKEFDLNNDGWVEIWNDVFMQYEKKNKKHWKVTFVGFISYLFYVADE